MGSDISCPCSRIDINQETHEEEKDILAKIMNGKLSQKEILLDFYNDTTKVCLIKTECIESFFNNRNLLRVPSKRDYLKYYNSVYISNYLAKNELTLIILLDCPFKQTQKKENFTPIDSGKYYIECINLVASTPDQVIKQILHNFNLNLKKNYRFIGIINDSPKFQRQFYNLYKMHYSKVETKVEYSIQIYKGEINEKVINDILTKKENKYKKLKSIMIDFTLYSCDDSINIINNEDPDVIIRKNKDIYRQCK